MSNPDGLSDDELLAGAALDRLGAAASTSPDRGGGARCYASR